MTWDEREALLKKCTVVAGCESIIEKFLACGASRPVMLEVDELSPVRVVVECWRKARAVLDWLERLLVALVRADPGGEVGTPRFEA